MVFETGKPQAVASILTGHDLQQGQVLTLSLNGTPVARCAQIPNASLAIQPVFTYEIQQNQPEWNALQAAVQAQQDAQQSQQGQGQRSYAGRGGQQN